MWMIFGITAAGILANTLLTPNIPDVLADLGQPESRAGILVASGPLPGVFMAPIMGVLADRFGRRQVLLPCLVIFAIGGLLAAVAPTFELLLAARVLQGVGGAGLINLAIVLIGDHWEGAERTRLIGHNSAVLTLCLAILPLVSGVIAEISSWRFSLGVSVLALPIAAVAYRVLPDIRPATGRTIGQQLRGAVSVLKQPTVLTVLVSGVLLFMVIFGVFLTTLPVHLEEQFGYGPALRGVILSVPAVGSTIAAFNLGRIRKRFSARAVLVASSVLIAFAAFGIGVASLIGLVIVAAIIYGLGDGAAISALQDVATSAAPTEQRASVMAAWVSSVRLGQTIGPLSAAALFAATSTTTTMMVGAAIFAGVAVLLVFAPLDASDA